MADRMMKWPDPLPLGGVVAPGIVPAVEAALSLARRSGAEGGGITIGIGDRPRVLIYHGPCPTRDVEIVLRALLPGDKVSTIRSPDQIKPAGVRRSAGQYRTATRANPTGQ